MVLLIAAIYLSHLLSNHHTVAAPFPPLPNSFKRGAASGLLTEQCFQKLAEEPLACLPVSSIGSCFPISGLFLVICICCPSWPLACSWLSISATHPDLGFVPGYPCLLPALTSSFLLVMHVCWPPWPLVSSWLSISATHLDLWLIPSDPFLLPILTFDLFPVIHLYYWSWPLVCSRLSMQIINICKYPIQTDINPHGLVHWSVQ